MMTVRVLIVDDHAVVRQGLQALLTSRPEVQVVGEAAEGAQAVQLAQALRPDVILLDLLMPEMDGVAVLQQVRQIGLPSKILILSSSLDDERVLAAVRAGADGYILKASRVGELVQAIVRVAQGQRVLDPAVTQVLVDHLHGADPLASLSAREREVFDQLARGRSNGEIAAALHVGEATVRTHVASVLDKLGLRDRTQIIIYALKRGVIRIENLP
ncbi:MAG: response regulator transcription factor [Kouleothrix sp.]|nr:response regulator transcription factor [Kouleothrix sp.]